ncbi:hypothetical protein, partial [Albidovulum sp.]|uniref:hypothetical protein n=1 Tax=Albidovulum sp. TaxID=1872424 RepID=UPI0039B93285
RALPPAAGVSQVIFAPSSRLRRAATETPAGTAAGRAARQACATPALPYMGHLVVHNESSPSPDTGHSSMNTGEIRQIFLDMRAL